MWHSRSPSATLGPPSRACRPLPLPTVACSTGAALSLLVFTSGFAFSENCFISWLQLPFLKPAICISLSTSDLYPEIYLAIQQFFIQSQLCAWCRGYKGSLCPQVADGAKGDLKYSVADVWTRFYGADESGGSAWT